jgi:hypothetical protein
MRESKPVSNPTQTLLPSPQRTPILCMVRDHTIDTQVCARVDAQWTLNRMCIDCFPPKRNPVIPATHPSHIWPISPCSKLPRSVQLRASCSRAKKKKKDRKESWQALVAVECRSRTVRMESEGPGRARTRSDLQCQRSGKDKVGKVLMPSRIEVEKDQGTAPQKCNQE